MSLLVAPRPAAPSGRTSTAQAQALEILYEAPEPAGANLRHGLGDELSRTYGGDLGIRLRADRPTVIANFVETLDGQRIAVLDSISHERLHNGRWLMATGQGPIPAVGQRVDVLKMSLETPTHRHEMVGRVVDGESEGEPS